MNFQEASELLAKTTRDELRDHAFGDREVYFSIGEVTIAEGYAGPSGDTVVFNSEYDHDTFSGEKASALLKLGTAGKVERNDSQQDDDSEYEEDGCPLFDDEDEDDL